MFEWTLNLHAVSKKNVNCQQINNVQVKVKHLAAEHNTNLILFI